MVVKITKFLDILDFINDNTHYSYVNTDNISIIENESGEFGISFNKDFQYRFDNIKCEKFPFNFSTCPKNTGIHLTSELSSCKLKTLEGLPKENLSILSIRDLDWLENLKGMPDTLDILQISRCQKLKSLAGISTNIRKIILSDLDIKHLDHFPVRPHSVELLGLRLLDLKGCPNAGSVGSILRIKNNLYAIDLSYVPDFAWLQIEKTQVKNIESLKNYKGHITIDNEIYNFKNGDSWEFFVKGLKRKEILA